MLYEFQRTDLLHAIKMIDVRPQITNDKIEHLDAKFDIEVLAFADSKSRESLAPGSKPDGRKLDEFQFLAKKNFFQPTTIMDREKAIAATARDDRSSVSFYGTVTQSGEKHRGVQSYVFYHPSAAKPLFTLNKGEDLVFPGFSGKILGYDPETNEVVLQSGEKILGVKAGKTISTGKERPKPPAAMTLASQPNA
jgi:hypothetical protein